MRRSIRVGSRGHGCLANWPWHNLIANQGNKTATSPWPGPNTYLTSTVYWCIASKLKVPLFFFFMEWIKRFVGGFVIFQSVLLWRYCNDKKAYRILAVLPFKMSATSLSCGQPWGLASIPWATSTVYWCIASKLKAPWNFYWMSNMFLWVEIFLFFVCYHVVPKRHSQLDYELNGL